MPLIFVEIDYKIQQQKNTHFAKSVVFYLWVFFYQIVVEFVEGINRFRFHFVYRCHFEEKEKITSL